jgi:radical SAM family uncharacterized protein
MLNEDLKTRISSFLLPRVQSPGQYVGGELHAVRKDHRAVRGTVCLAFPDTYSIGMSHHGLQVLYSVMNQRADWACQRVFAPGTDMEALLRQHGLPLYGLESFTPLSQFNVLGFTLQYEMCYTNVLTILDLGGIPVVAADRTAAHPLVIAGGPCVSNPEPMARFIDLFVIGDGEEMLPRVCDLWLELSSGGGAREEMLLEMATRLPHVYVPRFYEAQPSDGFTGAIHPLRPDVPSLVKPATVTNLDAIPLPTQPVLPSIDCVHDRIAIEIMRGCPHRCRFCQSTTIKRPLQYRRVETIVAAALETYRNTGYNEISLLSLSTSDYPLFNELMRRMQEVFRPMGVSVSVPSLRINEQLRIIGELLNTDRHSGLTLAPEVARDDMREQIGKKIKNEDLFAGCRTAMANGFDRVKLYFLCGLPGEREIDLDGILEMGVDISRIGKEIRGQFATVVLNVSNFVPKPQTPYQWNGMQTRQYFDWAHNYLRQGLRYRSIQLKYHDTETSLLEGILARGDRRIGEVIETVWRRGARFDAWSEQLRKDLWWQALAEAGIDWETSLRRSHPQSTPLPWDHIGIRQGRSYLEDQQKEALLQLAVMGCGVESTQKEGCG